MVCANAIGNVLPNTFLVKDKDERGWDMNAALRAFGDFNDSFGPPPSFIATPYGKVTKRAMVEWFYRVFDKQARLLYQLNHGKPAPSRSKKKLGVLILDWAPAHVAEEVRTVFKDSQWVVLGLVPGSTHIAQPMDQEPFSNVRPLLRAKIKAASITRRMTCAELMPVVDWAARKSASREAVQAGFKACGIVPYSPDPLRRNWQRRAKHPRGANFELVRKTGLPVPVNVKTKTLATPEQIKKVCLRPTGHVLADHCCSD